MSSGCASEALVLLPSSEESPKCSEFSKTISEDPGGTAFAAAAVVLIEVPLPWPKPVFQHPVLANWNSETDFHMGKSKVLATVPSVDSRNIFVTIFERTTDGVAIFKCAFASVDELEDFRQELLSHHPNEIDGTQRIDGTSHRAVLICTQGSHDICCGSLGTRFAEEVERNIDRVAVYRVSHTGGHRFAPTAMTFPDGRMWAGLDIKLLESIMESMGNARDLAPRCRGWWGATRGLEQIAERSVFAELGWSLNHLPRRVTVTETPDGWTAEVKVTNRTWEVTIRKGRVVPSVSCRADGGLPSKLHTEYLVTSVHQKLD